MEAAIRPEDVDLHVPALCDVEVASALRRGLLTRRLDTKRAAEALQDYLDMPLTRHGHEGLLPRVLALGFNLSAFDATYVALAEHLGGALLTADERLAAAVRTTLSLTTLPA